jgi:hypothetical protein
MRCSNVAVVSRVSVVNHHILPRYLAFVALVVCATSGVVGCSEEGPAALAGDAALNDVADAADVAGDVGLGDLADTDIDAAADLAEADSDVAPDGGDAEDTAATDLVDGEAADGPAPDVTCEAPEPFDYSCSAGDPSSCPGGLCILGLCVGAVYDEGRWDACGDGTCDPCEGACPADCARPPALDRPRRYDRLATTLTVVIPGFNVISESEFEESVYGAVRSGGDIGENGLAFAPDVPDYRTAPEAPNQMVGVEYYGALAPEWMSEADAALVESFDWRTEQALHRYALVVAKFIRWRAELVGATDVNLLCHSMGCHITRYLLENDIEGVASSGLVARWTTIAGVIAGARLARLFDNPTVREVAPVIGINSWDFVHMHPDYVRDNSAVWDHDVRRADNPLLAGLAVHHVVATDPRVSETANIVRLLDLNNPDDEPNDGIVYSLDEYFHDQDEANRVTAVSGARLAPTRSYRNRDHFLVKEEPGTGILIAASLYHSRRVRIALTRLELLDDLESHRPFDGRTGTEPAEIAVRTEVRFNPYVLDTFGVDAVVAEQAVEDRSPELTRASQGSTRTLDYVLFEGPVFDDMDALYLTAELLEVDWYPRFEVVEWAADVHERLIRIDRSIPLENGDIVIENEKVRATLTVTVESLY